MSMWVKLFTLELTYELHCIHLYTKIRKEKKITKLRAFRIHTHKEKREKKIIIESNQLMRQGHFHLSFSFFFAFIFFILYFFSQKKSFVSCSLYLLLLLLLLLLNLFLCISKRICIEEPFLWYVSHTYIQDFCVALEAGFDVSSNFIYFLHFFCCHSSCSIHKKIFQWNRKGQIIYIIFVCDSISFTHTHSLWKNLDWSRQKLVGMIVFFLFLPFFDFTFISSSS